VISTRSLSRLRPLASSIVPLSPPQLVLRPGQSTGVAIAFGVLGFAMMPLLPVSFESAVECTYPVNEETSSGMLMLAGMRACGRKYVQDFEDFHDSLASHEEICACSDD
jgi:hypothetical protein